MAPEVCLREDRLIKLGGDPEADLRLTRGITFSSGPGVPESPSNQSAGGKVRGQPGQPGCDPDN